MKQKGVVQRHVDLTQLAKRLDAIEPWEELIKSIGSIVLSLTARHSRIFAPARVRPFQKGEGRRHRTARAGLSANRAPEYRTALKKVWLLRQAPASVLTAIGLPRNDKGVDLIAQHHDRTYWVIQAKYRTAH
jgi:hypothetical protein